MAEGVESSNFFCQKWILDPKKWGYRHKFFENRITFAISRSLYFQKKCYVAAKWALIKEMNIETWKRPIFVRFSKNLCLYPHFLGSRIHFWQKNLKIPLLLPLCYWGLTNFGLIFKIFVPISPFFWVLNLFLAKKFWKFHFFYHVVIGIWPILVWFSTYLKISKLKLIKNLPSWNFCIISSQTTFGLSPLGLFLVHILA